MNIVSVVELQEPTLGRLLVSKLTVSVLSQARELLDEGLAADDFASEFFAAQARRARDEAPVSRTSYNDGEAISPEELKALTPEARDRLAADYLALNQPSGESKSGARTAPLAGSPLAGTNPAERGTDRLMRYVEQKRTSFMEDPERGLRILNGPSAGASWEDPQKLRSLGLLDVNDEFTRAAKQVADLSSDMRRMLGGTLGPLHLPEMFSTMPVPPDLKPAPDPGWETVAQVSKMRDDIAPLVAVAQKQAELTLALVDYSKAIAKDSNKSLHLAVHSSKQAAAATRLAGVSVILTLLAILAALFIGRYSVNSTIANANLLGASAERHAQEEIRLLQEMANDPRTRANSTPLTAPNGGTAPKPAPSEKSPK